MNKIYIINALSKEGAIAIFQDKNLAIEWADDYAKGLKTIYHHSIQMTQKDQLWIDIYVSDGKGQFLFNGMFQKENWFAR